MRIWGIVSERDQTEGFDLVMDEEGYLVLVSDGQPLARYDPMDHTLSSLCKEVESELERRRDSNLLLSFG